MRPPPRSASSPCGCRQVKAIGRADAARHGRPGGQNRPVRGYAADRRLGRRARGAGGADRGAGTTVPGGAGAAGHHLAASGRHRQRRAGTEPSRPCWAAEARDLRHLRQLAADFRSCAGRENRRLHAAAGRAVATDARDGGGAARADHADRAFYLCRSAARRRSAKPVRHGGPRRTRRDARRGAAVLQEPSRRRLLPARHDGRRGRQRDDGARGVFRRDAVAGAGHAALRRRRDRAGQARRPARHAAAEAGEDPGHSGRSRGGRAGAVADLRDVPQPGLCRRVAHSAVRHSRAAARCAQGDRAPRRARIVCGRGLQSRLRRLDRDRQRRCRGRNTRRHLPDQRTGHDRRRARPPATRRARRATIRR